MTAGRGYLAPLIKLVIFAVVTLVATAALAATIANTDTGGTTYRARFTDATGLNPGDDVRISGVRVGQVTDVSVVDRRLAEVEFTVQTDHKLSASAGAAIRYRNLVGQRYLALTQGPGTPGVLPAGGTIPVPRTVPALDLTVLFNGFKPLFTALSPDDVNKLSYEIIQVLQGEGGTVGSLLAHTASLTSTIADRDQVIGSLIDNLNTVLGTVAQRDQELSGLISSLQQLVSGLAADRKPIGDAISTLADLSTGTAGLLTDARPSLKDSITGLGQLSANLNDSQPLVEKFLNTLPDKVGAITRLGSYGSWFNFYNCSISGSLKLDGQTYVVPLLSVPAAQQAVRCR